MISLPSSPETQDSEVSGQNEAPVRSELMEEAKLKTDILVELYSQFEFKLKRFPEKVRKHNKGIFNDWKGLFKTVDKCTGWVPLQRNHLNSRLQNPPGEDGMFQVVPMHSSHNSTAMDQFNPRFGLRFRSLLPSSVFVLPMQEVFH